MKHRTRAVAPDVRGARRPARRLAARTCCVLAAAWAISPSVEAGELRRPAWSAESPVVEAAGPALPSASPGHGTRAVDRGAVATSGARRDAALRPATPGSASAVYVASRGVGLPESRTWALFGVGLLAVLMMARRQRQQHD